LRRASESRLRWRTPPAMLRVSGFKRGTRPMRTFKLAALLLIASAPSAVQAAPAPLANVTAAVASSSRSADNMKLDESRKPAAVLRFLGLRRGMSVIDLFGANRYWAEIIAPAVGPKGHVLVWNPTQFASDEENKAFAEFVKQNPNVSLDATRFEAISLPKNSAELVMLNLNYHDTYWQSEKYGVPRMDPQHFLKVVYAAMKPGAVIGVIDHVANPNKDTRATVDKLHRIDPNVIKADFRRAGFQLVGTSNLLRNSADDHNLLVFDPKIKGKTDRAIFKFRKPR
jgi:predicted methyltransferase